MKKVELKIHPGKVYEIHEKEFEDLRRMGLVSRVVNDEPVTVEVDNSVDNLSEETHASLPEIEPVKKRTYKRKTSPTQPKSE